jgi:diaminopimelate epimerase
MHGLGNDFVVIDARAGKPGAGIAIGDAVAAAIADRHTGIGCDQLIVVEDAPGADADAFMRIRNADGGEVDACGNATRCVGAVLLGESGADTVRIRTGADLLTVTRADGGLVTVDMGVPRLGWDDVPLAMAADTLHLDLERGSLADPAAASMGNPHATFFVDDADAVLISVLGPELEVDPMFPERANIGIAQMLAPDRMRLRVWERGAGLTPACGTGACAAVVNASRRGLANRRMVVEMDGGELLIDWREDTGHVFMTGPAETSFAGVIAPDLLTGLPS